MANTAQGPPSLISIMIIYRHGMRKVNGKWPDSERHVKNELLLTVFL